MSSYLKALVGAALAGLGSLYQALDNGEVVAQEWVAVALATLATLGAVYGVPNRDPQGRRQDESVQPPDAGRMDVAYALVVGILALVFLVVLFAVLGRV
jgi:hypothetical protein